MRSDIIDKNSSFYFLGIGGISMSGLAKYLLSLCKRVGGSDACENEFTAELIKIGAQIDAYDKAEVIDGYDVVVYTDAIGENDERLKRARSLGKIVISRGRFLYEVSRNFKNVIAISGCHGKTTCSAMLAHIFAAAQKAFTVHVGGKDLKFSNFYSGGSDFLITEACEYKKNFLHLKPNVAVILNSDADHIECYGSEEAVKCAYLDFSNSADKAILLQGDLPKAAGITFGLEKMCDYYANDVETTNGKSSFTVYNKSQRLGEVKLNVYGKHNVLNALAAVAVARSYGIAFEQIVIGLNNFVGVERRFERLGEFDGAICYADYAHHPQEIRTSIDTAGRIASGRVFAIFQPHTYSRTKLLFDGFVDVLSTIENLMIYKTFAAREYFDDCGSALTLSQSIATAQYGDCVDDIKDFIAKAQKGDVVIFLGAGDIYYLAKQICAEQSS